MLLLLRLFSDLEMGFRHLDALHTSPATACLFGNRPVKLRRNCLPSVSCRTGHIAGRLYE